MTADVPQPGKITDGIACASDATQTYAVYLPKAYTPDRKWPLLFLFDPRRRGAFAAEKVAEAAEKYGWIVASSNDTISDGPMEPNIRALNAMLPDVPARFAVDPSRIYAGGFSGGAMLSWAVGTGGGTRLAGVIGCSGRLDDPSKVFEVSFDWFGTAGTTDFNYPETLAIDRRLAAIGASHRMEVFDGSHQWASPALLSQAISWMELQAMKRGLRARDEGMIASLYADDLGAARQLEQSGRILDAWLRYDAITRTFTTLHPVDESTAAMKRLEGPTLQKARDEQRKSEELETSFRDRIPDVLGQLISGGPVSANSIAGDLEIRHLQQMGKGTGPQATAARRVLETIFAQAVFYLPRDFMAARKYAQAADSLTIARQIHPESVVAAYDLACAEALRGSRRAAFKALRAAIELGYSDRDHLQTDDDLASLRGDPQFAKLVATMRPSVKP